MFQFGNVRNMEVMMRLQALFLVTVGTALAPSPCGAQSLPPNIRYHVQDPTLLNPKPGRFVVTRTISLGDQFVPGSFFFPSGPCSNFSEKMDSNDADLTKTEEALKDKLVKDVHECVEQLSKISEELK